jgi:hypothetical protein
MTSSPYRLDELGWLQFDRLCLLLMADTGLTDLHWRGQADTGRVAAVDDQVALRAHGVVLPGPVTVAIVWVRADTDLERRMSNFIDRVMRWPAELEDRVLVLTNLDGAQALEALQEEKFTERRHVAVVGAREIGSSCSRTRTTPSWLAPTNGSRSPSYSTATTAARSRPSASSRAIEAFSTS